MHAIAPRVLARGADLRSAITSTRNRALFKKRIKAKVVWRAQSLKVTVIMIEAYNALIPSSSGTVRRKRIQETFHHNFSCTCFTRRAVIGSCSLSPALQDTDDMPNNSHFIHIIMHTFKTCY